MTTTTMIGSLVWRRHLGDPGGVKRALVDCMHTNVLLASCSQTPQRGYLHSLLSALSASHLCLNVQCLDVCSECSCKCGSVLCAVQQLIHVCIRCVGG